MIPAAAIVTDARLAKGHRHSHEAIADFDMPCTRISCQKHHEVETQRQREVAVVADISAWACAQLTCWRLLALCELTGPCCELINRREHQTFLSRRVPSVKEMGQGTARRKHVGSNLRPCFSWTPVTETNPRQVQHKS